VAGPMPQRVELGVGGRVQVDRGRRIPAVRGRTGAAAGAATSGAAGSRCRAAAPHPRPHDRAPSRDPVAHALDQQGGPVHAVQGGVGGGAASRADQVVDPRPRRQPVDTREVHGTGGLHHHGCGGGGGGRRPVGVDAVASTGPTDRAAGPGPVGARGRCGGPAWGGRPGRGGGQDRVHRCRRRPQEPPPHRARHEHPRHRAQPGPPPSAGAARAERCRTVARDPRRGPGGARFPVAGRLGPERGPGPGAGRDRAWTWPGPRRPPAEESLQRRLGEVRAGRPAAGEPAGPIRLEVGW
jgi:hypothetical protein